MPWPRSSCSWTTTIATASSRPTAINGPCKGAISDYKEKMFGGHTRSYDFGTDVLTFANCNFLWDSVLLAGRSFRNYGECEFPSTVQRANWFDIYHDFVGKKGKITVPPFDFDGDVEKIYLPDVSRLEPGHPRRLAAGCLLEGVPPIREVGRVAELRASSTCRRTTPPGPSRTFRLPGPAWPTMTRP